ncbi:intracellular septation protein [Nitrosomonas sp. PY1]|uniref:septation protein A n=1 Tax=Nitrosomonas sp. PY1 TaxID=1803906 RepID=UPI001FC7F104|nr:septation protein A [Nitrosomonas sp. PY1]GKS68405.1 intracellular septation protein [Nitrosomonas sp. PY1]
MKFLFDLFPIILFFVAFKLYDIFVATAVAIVASILQIIWVWLRHHQIDKMMWINLMIIIVFGGATLAFQDETFIKWKPTILYWFFAIALLVSDIVFKKNLIQATMEKQMTLPLPIWAKLNTSWVIFFITMGLINLYVAFNFPIDTWVTFKLFGSTGLMLVFIAGQVLMLSKHLKENSTELTIGSQEVYSSEKNISEKGEK